MSHAVEDSLDGTDRLRNIERLQFADGNPLNIIVGTPNNDVLNGTALDDLMLGLAGNDMLNGGAGNDILVGGPNGAATGGTLRRQLQHRQLRQFHRRQPGTGLDGDNDSGSATTGQIRIDDGNNVLRFYGGAGRTAPRSRACVDLSSANTATITYDFDADNLDGARQPSGCCSRPMASTYVLLNTIDANDNGTGNSATLVSGPFSATARIRFEATAHQLARTRTSRSTTSSSIVVISPPA